MLLLQRTDAMPESSPRAIQQINPKYLSTLLNFFGTDRNPLITNSLPGEVDYQTESQRSLRTISECNQQERPS
jgi:hypothetical protein